ncbi:putative ribonuclease H-like domain-containing protein [Tanacetum coccineum]
MKKMYCLVVTDDFSRFSWVFFLATKDETSEILKTFITGIENLIDLRVKVIRCDNGTEFKNRVMNQFCEMKGIKREFSVARTPQQNGVAKRKNRTLIEAARTMLAGFKNCQQLLDEAVNTAVNSKDSLDARFKPSREEEKKDAEDLGNESGNPIEGKDSEVPSTEEPRINQEKDDNINYTNNINTASDGNSTNNVNAVSSIVNAAVTEVNAIDLKTSIELPNDPNMLELKDIIYSDDDEDVGAEADMNNLDAFMPISLIPTTRIHKDHPDELLQFKLQKVWTLMDLPNGKRAIGTKWVYRNKKDERDIVIKIKAILMDVKSAFLYGKIEEEVYVCQPPGFEDPNFSDRVYKVEKALYGLHQAPRASYETLSTYLLDNGFQRRKINKTLFIRRVKSDILLVQVYVDDIIFGSTKKSLCIEFKKMMHKKFQMSSIGKLTFFLGLQVKQKEDGIFISQDKYVTEILKKIGFIDVKTASTPMETHKPLLKDADGEDVDEHLRQDSIGKSTTRGCQFLGCRLISWQCKKQTVVANSITEDEYITEIHIDNESAICIVMNPVFHSKTKNIEIRHHFIRDSYKKKLIQMIKIHTDQNVVDLLTKAFDVSRFQYLIASIGMLNL